MRTIVDQWVQIVDVTSVTKEGILRRPTRDGTAPEFISRLRGSFADAPRVAARSAVRGPYRKENARE